MVAAMSESSKTRWNLLFIVACSVASNLAAELLADEVKVGVKVLGHVLGILTP
jgi:hypothetical protein